MQQFSQPASRHAGLSDCEASTQRAAYCLSTAFASSSDVRNSSLKPSLKSGSFVLQEFHRVRKPALLQRLLVYGQSSDDKQRPYAKSHVWAVCRSLRIVPYDLRR
ncbi:hypothetical protein EVAR_95268_1 [Eumeta japonica]|uniref:Uncharacterized protein n=1 Tax=Eumeta variegata TaxID=151549 RepID=A0A4C1ULB3_EUMVA|nr:hypothetical protein EVAR_95268_1 [Eumeta japonica]